MMFTMLEVKRSGSVYLECMSQCLLLELLRDNLEAVGLPWQLGDKGMFVLVDPAVYDDVVTFVMNNPVEFEDGFRWFWSDGNKARYLIVPEGFGDFLVEVVWSFWPGSGVDGGNCRDKPKPKRQVSFHIPLPEKLDVGGQL